MPFLDRIAGSDDFATSPKTEVRLRQLPPKQPRKTNFTVLDSFGWTTHVGTRPSPEDRVAADRETDLASVPPFLWGLIASYGTHTMPAILHDVQWDSARATADARHRALLRRRADALFRKTLRDHAHLGVATRWLMWGGVRLFGSVWIGVCVVAAAAVGLLHWSAPLFRATGDLLEELTTWPLLVPLKWVPQGVAWLLERASDLFRSDVVTWWTMGGLIGVAVVLMVLRAFERSTAGGPTAWSPAAFGSLLGAAVVGFLGTPPLFPIVIVTAVTRLLLWLLDLLLHPLAKLLFPVMPEVREAPADERPPAPSRPPFPGVFPKP